MDSGRHPDWRADRASVLFWSPQQLEPDTRLKRTTAPISYHLKRVADHWATTLAYGRNQKSVRGADVSERGWLLESTYLLADTHTFFTRAEQVNSREALPGGPTAHGKEFRIAIPIPRSEAPLERPVRFQIVEQ